MKSKLLIFFIFILLAFASNQEKNNVDNLKRKRKNTNFDLQNKQFSFIFTLTKTQSKQELIFNFSSSQKFPILNLILENKANMFTFIFPCLDLFQLEFEVQCVCKTLHNLYNKFIEREKHVLKTNLENKEKFEANIKSLTQNYFDVFEKRHPMKAKGFVNIDIFSENLFIFPKSIRQILCFYFQGIEFRYILFKNGDLSVLKKLNNKFRLTTLKNDFLKMPFYDDNTQNLDMKQILTNIRYVTISNIWCKKISIVLYRKDDILKFDHQDSFEKICVYCSAVYRGYQFLFLKNLSGYLTLSQHGVVDLISYYGMQTSNFKENVKAFESKDYEDSAETVRFEYKK